MTKRNNNRKRQTKRIQRQEVSAVGKILRELGGLGGAAAGSFVGQPGLGGSAGRELAAKASKWLGFGDYEVSSNSIVKSMRATGTVPAMHKDDQTIVVRHREYLGELDGSTSFTMQSIFPLNPGMSATFPWLSAVAGRFQEYKIKGMVFHFVPTSGTAISSTSAALGSVMFQTSYRASDTGPTSKVEMLNEYWATEGRPCDEIVHAIECDPKENPFDVHYVRTGSLPSTENQLLYDIGTTFVATNGMQTAGQTLGDIWVTYEVELKKPVVASATNEVNRAMSVYSAGTSTTTWFTSPVYSGNLGITVSNPGLITFPKGTAGFFYVYITVPYGAGLTTFSPPASPTMVECTPANISQSSTLISSTITGSSTCGVVVFGLFKPDPNAVATVNLGALSVGTASVSGITTTIYRRDTPLWP